MLLSELAALGTSLCWSATSTFFTLGGRLVGSVAVNRTRLALAVLFLTLTHFLLGTPLPLDVEPWRWFWLTLSGVLGLVLGDSFLFQAFVWVGPRLSTLIMTMVPVIGAGLAWLFLDERLGAQEMVGIGLTVGGVAWVVWSQTREGDARRPQRGYLLGIVFALLGATGQASGLITAKVGLADGFSPLSATLIRMFTAMLIMWGFAAARGQVRPTLRRLRESGSAFR
ncbi:MAG: DMT family transporter, partial [Chloroflexi bacterium]|nr:DMT family transporter [Chloroflexota bacterium]